MKKLIEAKDIRVGDLIRQENPMPSYEALEYRAEEAGRSRFTGMGKGAIYLLDRPVVLPTGEDALVAHPTDRNRTPYYLSGGEWYQLPGAAIATEDRVKNAIINNGFEVVYAGIEL